MAIVAAVLIVGVAGVSFAAGRFTVGGNRAKDPVRLEHGVPVGVERTRGGALAAADDYLAVEQETVERSPPRFVSLVDIAYERSIQADSLTAAAADRQRDPVGMRLWRSGGESFTIVGAHRLDRYGGNVAHVAVWAGQVFWGPGQVPTQAWGLAELTLRWQGGRWLVAAMKSLPGGVPVPSALAPAGPGDEGAAAFDSRLAGFTPVSYGAPG